MAKIHGVAIKVSAEELTEALNPQHALEKRKHVGGTNSLITLTSIKTKETKVGKVKTWILREQERIKHAKSVTEKLAQKIIDGGHV